MNKGFWDIYSCNISINAGKEAEVNLENEPALVRKHPAIPNSNGSVGYRIDFASVPQNRVNELPIGFCRNGSPRFEFYRDAEL
ncbi:MAG: hypothetical protein PX481_09435, partial [Microcystis sp. M53603_WE2]|uniref:hypothetical protein n=1 Tax=unclassified Microcystis TaxID=2643300 RepID=UPI00258FE979